MVADSRLRPRPRPRSSTVHFYGYRIACSNEKKNELEHLLTTYRKPQKAWTHAELKKVVSKIRNMDWGVCGHGGNRRHGVLGRKSAETAQSATQVQVANRPRHRHRKKKPLAVVVVSPKGAVTVGASSHCSASKVASMSSKVAIGTNVSIDMVECASIIAQKGDSPARVSPLSGDNNSLVQSRTCTFGYEVERRIGKGAFGQVFQARSKSGHRVAIKQMPCKPGAKLTSMQRREVDVLSKIHGHPNIVNLQEVNTTGFGVELVFDLADCTLRDCMKGGVMLPVQVARYAMGLFNGLTFLHSNDIIHRDIKPDNLLIASDMLLIADLGWARELAIGNTSLTSNAYSLWWRPPEVLMGSQEYDFSADVWAAGCVCAEMSEGRPAFPGMSEYDTLQLQLKAFGTPRAKDWPGLFKLPQAKAVRHYPAKPWMKGRRICDEFVTLLQGVLKLVPIIRSTASEALVLSQGIVETI